MAVRAAVDRKLSDAKMTIRDATKTSDRGKLLKRLRGDLEEVVLEPDFWLKTPHEMLGGREPLEVANSGEAGELLVRNLIRGIKEGMFT